jgi:hypothetical protein
MIAGILLRLAPFLVRQATRSVSSGAFRNAVAGAARAVPHGALRSGVVGAANLAANPLVQKGAMGASLAGYGVAEFGDQEDQRMADLVEQGYDPETAMEMVKQSPIRTVLRAAPTLAGEALMFGGFPLGTLAGTATMAAGGAYQGLDSAVNRGYTGLDTLGEVAAGATLGAIPGALEGGYYTNQIINRFRNRN